MELHLSTVTKKDIDGGEHYDHNVDSTNDIKSTFKLLLEKCKDDKTKKILKKIIKKIPTELVHGRDFI